MKNTITKEIVKSAIETLEQQDIYPSIERIRQITGGSSNRISKLRKELELENPQTSKKIRKNSSSGEASKKNTSPDTKAISRDIFAQIESRMMQMELLFTQRLADIDARFASREREDKDSIIKGLKSQIQNLESKNALLVKQLRQNLARVKELGQKLKQADDRIAELEAVKKPNQTQSIAKRPVSDNVEDDANEQKVIQSFNALINAQWDEEQNAEIALQKAVRQWLMMKWPADSHLLDNAVIESNINDKRYIAVSVSEDTSVAKPYIVHCLTLSRETEQLTGQRKDYPKVETANNKIHKWLNS